MCELSFVGFAAPQAAMLDGYRQALQKGWSPSTSTDVSASELSGLDADPAGYLAARADDAPPGTFTLPDGRTLTKLPIRFRWMWDGDFCGAINLRWKPGTTDLPDDVLGHIGYSVVPWKRGHGIAKRALRHMLFESREVGLPHVDVCTTEDNPASQRVITANGGVLVEAFRSALHEPGVPRLRYRIALG